jgi:hypothetical protein
MANWTRNRQKTNFSKNRLKLTSLFIPETDPDPDRKSTFKQNTDPDPDRLLQVDLTGIVNAFIPSVPAASD